MTGNDNLRERVADWATAMQVTEQRGGGKWAEGWNQAMLFVAEHAPAVLKEAAIEALPQRVERLEGALRKIANAAEWATASYLKANARAALGDDVG